MDKEKLPKKSRPYKRECRLRRYQLEKKEKTRKKEENVALSKSPAEERALILSQLKTSFAEGSTFAIQTSKFFNLNHYDRMAYVPKNIRAFMNDVWNWLSDFIALSRGKIFTIPFAMIDYDYPIASRHQNWLCSDASKSIIRCEKMQLREAFLGDDGMLFIDVAIISEVGDELYASSIVIASGGYDCDCRIAESVNENGQCRMDRIRANPLLRRDLIKRGISYDAAREFIDWRSTNRYNRANLSYCDYYCSSANVLDHALRRHVQLTPILQFMSHLHAARYIHDSVCRCEKCQSVNAKTDAAINAVGEAASAKIKITDKITDTTFLTSTALYSVMSITALALLGSWKMPTTGLAVFSASAVSAAALVATKATITQYKAKLAIDAAAIDAKTIVAARELNSVMAFKAIVSMERDSLDKWFELYIVSQIYQPELNGFCAFLVLACDETVTSSKHTYFSRIPSDVMGIIIDFLIEGVLSDKALETEAFAEKVLEMNMNQQPDRSAAEREYARSVADHRVAENAMMLAQVQKGVVVPLRKFIVEMLRPRDDYELLERSWKLFVG